MPAPSSKLASVLNVRCKSTTALLYTNKYETGSKGKCIQLGDEWLTPNEFEERAAILTFEVGMARVAAELEAERLVRLRACATSQGLAGCV